MGTVPGALILDMPLLSVAIVIFQSTQNATKRPNLSKFQIYGSVQNVNMTLNCVIIHFQSGWIVIQTGTMMMMMEMQLFVKFQISWIVANLTALKS